MTIENKLLKQAQSTIMLFNKQHISLSEKQIKLKKLFKDYNIEIVSFLAIIDRITCLCLKCGYLWLARTQQPKECPNCKRRLVKI